jgi:4-hydroxy-2-oxoheptanedioate aldolase
MARANRIREIWAEGKAVVNSWCGIPSSWSAEVMAHMGWDSLVVDMQHGLIDYQVMVTMLQGISTSNTVPLVRVPWNDPAHIQKALDAGAYGIVCPMINNRAARQPQLGADPRLALRRCRLSRQGQRHRRRLRHDRDRRGDGKS